MCLKNYVVYNNILNVHIHSFRCYNNKNFIQPPKKYCEN